MEVQALEVISINIWSVIASLGNLVIIFLIVKKFLFKPVRKVMAERESQVGRLYDDANEAKSLAEADKAAYSEKLANAKVEVGDIIRAAQARADRIGDDIIDDAKAKADELVKRADAEIAQDRKRAVNELKNEISSISIDIAEKMLDREIKEEDHDALINRFIEEMGEDDE